MWILTANLLMGVSPCKPPEGALQAPDPEIIYITPTPSPEETPTPTITPTPTPTPETPTPTPTPQKYLYVASGACYAGGVTTNAGTSVISKYSLQTGERIGTVFNYNNQSPGDLPVGLLEFSDTQILTAIENTGGRRLDLVSKIGNQLNLFLVNSTIFSGVFRGIARSSDLGILATKSSAIEKVTLSKIRVTQGTNPFISNPGTNGSVACGVTATNISFINELPNGKIIYGHAAATPNNKLVMISNAGYASTADCLAARAAPTTTALPTASVYHPSGKLLVSYGSTTFNSNFIYAYDINETTPSISAGSQIISSSVVNGVSAMAIDSETGSLFVANSTANSESIEKFNFDSGSGAFTRAGSQSFIPKSEHIRCVSGLLVSY